MVFNVTRHTGIYIRLVGALLLLAVSGAPAAPAVAAQSERLFRLPFLEDAGPSTWMLIQPYGNTTTAYRWRFTTYGAGQGLHFGIDLSAPCGTQVVAIGDGTVAKVDALVHGAAPHNLMINHDNGYASFYGHLLERPQVAVGERVRRGQVVALSGDPDLTCFSRPHLHLEIRNALSYTIAYNPAPLIDADWDSLMLAGPFTRGFARDLSDPRRWQFIDDQPEVHFGGGMLNNYDNPWPLDWASR